MVVVASAIVTNMLFIGVVIVVVELHIHAVSNARMVVWVMWIHWALVSAMVDAVDS